MGCDIFCYIDYDDFQTKDGGWYVSCFASDIAFGRNYTLFSLMAGVRHDPHTDNFTPLFQPRGLPKDISWNAKNAYTMYVSDDCEGKGYCSIEDATRWVHSGRSKWIGEKRISRPDWHSASWLYEFELRHVKEVYEGLKFPEVSWFQMKSPDKQPIPENATVRKIGLEWFVEVGKKETYPVPETFDAILAAMKMLNGDRTDRSRLVFWFD